MSDAETKAELTRLATHMETALKRLDKHSTAIDEVSKWRWTLVGALGVISVCASFAYNSFTGILDGVRSAHDLVMHQQMMLADMTNRLNDVETRVAVLAATNGDPHDRYNVH